MPPRHVYREEYTGRWTNVNIFTGALTLGRMIDITKPDGQVIRCHQSDNWCANHHHFSCCHFNHHRFITGQLCAQKFLMICCSFNWLSGIRFYQECKKLKCWLLTYWDHICIISFGIIDCCKHEKNRPNIGAVSNVWLRRSGETYKTWYPIILRQTCSSLARQCKIGG